LGREKNRTESKPFRAVGPIPLSPKLMVITASPSISLNQRGQISGFYPDNAHYAGLSLK
jgi:hypothetical protein